ncbi:MAG: 3-methyl-2-oxobutanoate hydroxymethyltransferase [Kordiimonas sp.]|nr:3-methyl-2-oxobutanoate hydroxymethyltransferase [Kordiimonas sp.]
MSAHREVRRNTIRDIINLKGKQPIVSLTAYTAPMATLLDPHCDFLLVGDSLAMALYGMDSTIGISLDTMIGHTQAVMRGSSNACVIVDMPFGSYEESKEMAYRNCAQAMAETGCAAVKLEGGQEMAETISFLTQRGIPVMAHVGLMPHAVNTMGGYRAQGREESEWPRIMKDAYAVQEAGAFSVVLEGVAEPLAQKISEELSIVTIGIGASNVCDGQILVTEDMLGFFAGNPKFVKRYAEIGQSIDEAIARYAQDVRQRKFPGSDHVYSMKRSH